MGQHACLPLLYRTGSKVSYGIVVSRFSFVLPQHNSLHISSFQTTIAIAFDYSRLPFTISNRVQYSATQAVHRAIYRTNVSAFSLKLY